MTDTALVCTSVAKGASCSATGSVTIPAGSFVDFRIDGADTSPAAVWTALDLQLIPQPILTNLRGNLTPHAFPHRFTA